MASEDNKIGLVPATLMVAGNMMGSGVFMLPANLAAIGSIAVIGWLVTIVGAIALALVFSKLTQIDPAAGGPYAYTKKAFGNYMGYQTNLVYWLANVVGNVGLVVAGLGYLTPFFPSLKDPLVMALGQIGIIWMLTYANILGPNVVARIQSFTTTLALFPIIGVALLGWFWFHPATFMDGWNVSGQSNMTALGMTLNFTLWAFIGVESASVSTAVVKDPTRNVPIATVAGVLLAAVCYILSSSAIMGIIPNQELIASSAPFSEAVRIALGSTAGNVVALCAAAGCLGSLGGWTLLVGQTAKAAADDGLFGNVFARVNRPRRTVCRFGHRSGNYDIASAGNNVADGGTAVWKNCVDCRYYDAAAVHLFFGCHQNFGPNKNDQKSKRVLYDCRFDCSNLLHDGDDRFQCRADALGADVRHFDHNLLRIVG